MYSCCLESILHRTTALIHLKDKTKHFIHSQNPSVAPGPPQGEQPNFSVCHRRRLLQPAPATPSPTSFPLTPVTLGCCPSLILLTQPSTHLCDSSVEKCLRSRFSHHFLQTAFQNPNPGQAPPPGFPKLCVHFCSTPTKSYCLGRA